VLRQRLVVELDSVLEVSLLLVGSSHSSEGPAKEEGEEGKRGSAHFGRRVDEGKEGRRRNELGDHLVISSKLSSLIDGLVARLDSLVELSLLEEDGCKAEKERKRSALSFIFDQHHSGSSKQDDKGKVLTSQVGEERDILGPRAPSLLVELDSLLEPPSLVRLVSLLLARLSLLLLSSLLVNLHRFSLLLFNLS